MITIRQVVEELVKDSPFLEEGLSQGLINLTSLARQFKPKIEKKLLKEVQIGAIVMALKRVNFSFEHSGSIDRLNHILAKLGDMTVRSNLVSFTFANSPSLSNKQMEIMQKASFTQNSFLTMIDGIFKTSLFVSNNLAPEVKRIFKEENQISTIRGLSSITLIIPSETVHVPGVYYSILKKIAWEGINFIEVISNFTEFTLFLDEKNVDRAFSALKSKY